MIYSLDDVALLDANILYPAPIRDYILRLASLELFKPKWTSEIQEEWIASLLRNRPDLKRVHLEVTRDAMNSAFPDANIEHYEELITSISLPDLKDRHVLASAIKGNADVLVTFNIKDFPRDYLKKYGLAVQHPDEFVCNLVVLDKLKAEEALQNMIKSLRKPSKTREEVLAALLRCGLKNAVSMF
jgi:predicted nucleic acid-binding protein